MATVCETPVSKRPSLKSNVEETVIGVSNWTFSKLPWIHTIWPTIPSHEPSLRPALTPPSDSGDNVVVEVSPPCSPHLSCSNLVNESGQRTPSPNPEDTDTAQNSEALQTPSFSVSQDKGPETTSPSPPQVSTPVQTVSDDVDPKRRPVDKQEVSLISSAVGIAQSPIAVSDSGLSSAPRNAGSTGQLTRDVGESSATRSSTRIHIQPVNRDLVIFEYVPGLVEPVGKDRFMLPQVEISSSLVDQWSAIQPKLDMDLKLITAKLGLRFDQIITSAQFVVVGPKIGSQIHGLPTVVITCGSKKCEKLVRKALSKGQFQCLKELPHPPLVRYKAPPALWYASQSPPPIVPTVAHDEIVYEPKGQVRQRFSLQQRALFIELLEPHVLPCPRRLKFEDGEGGLQVTKFSTIGGIIRVDGEPYGLTSAHTIFASLGVSYPADRYNSDLEDNPSDESEDECITDDTSDEGIGHKTSNTSSRSPSLPRSEIDTREYDLVSWLTLDWDGACSFAGWGGAFDRSQSDGCRMHRQSVNSDWAIFRISDPSMQRTSNWYHIYDEVHERYEQFMISPTPMLNHQLTPGPVWIVTDSDLPALPASLTQTTMSLYVAGSSLHVRQILTPATLGDYPLTCFAGYY
jgi:hypothetical protein